MKIINIISSFFHKNNVPQPTTIHYLPWVGKKYNEATKKILVLGESHYCANAIDDKQTLTQEIIDDFISPYTEWEPYKNTYTKFTRALAGYDVPRDEIKDIWEYIMFYNYVQFPITGPRIPPTSKQFTDSENAFWCVVDMYQPDYIIAWGKRLFGNMPNNISTTEKMLVDLDFVQIRVYNYSGRKIKVMQMTHPSAAYIWKFWHNAINKLIEE